MPVTVKTFATSGEAAAALSSERDARYLGGGTLVMRALNEGDLSVSTVVRATDRGLTQLDIASSRITIGAGVTFARVLAERELGFLHPVAGSIGGPAVRNMGTIGGNLFAPTPFGDFAVAMLALDATVSVQGGYVRARRADRGVPCRARPVAGRARPLHLLPAPVQRRCVSLSQNRAHQTERRLGGDARRASSMSGGRIVGARIALGAMAATPVRAKRPSGRSKGGCSMRRASPPRSPPRRKGLRRSTIRSPALVRARLSRHLRRLLTGQD